MNFPWRTITVVSLAVNLLIAGAAIGFFMSHFPRGGGPRPFDGMGRIDRPGGGFGGGERGGGQGGGQGGLRNLPDPEREALSRALREAWDSGADLRAKAQAAREKVGQIVTRDPYEEANVRKALAEMRAADDAVLAHYQDALAASLSKLSAEQRLIALRAANRPGLIVERRIIRRGGRDGGPPEPLSGLPPP